MINTVVVAPFSSVLKQTYFGVRVTKSKVNGIDFDSRLEISQLRTISHRRLIKPIGKLEEQYRGDVREKLEKFFDLSDEFGEV